MNALQDDILASTLISRYTVVRLIGTGGMGRVYLARDERLLRHVAIKVLTSPQATESDTSRRLLREARLLSRLSDPFIASLFDCITYGAQDCLVMEFVPGPTLKEVIAAGPLPCGEVVRLGIQMARGLAAAHAASVIHRDLKPHNLKLTSWGQLKILDFGVATSAGAVDIDSRADTRTDNSPAGTIPYMSPEQIRGEDLDERTDIFSAGAVLYELAAGRPAFPQCNLAQLVDAIQFCDPPALSSINPFVPNGLERVVAKAMQKDRDRRHARATLLAAELRALRLQPPAIIVTAPMVRVASAAPAV